MKYNTIYAFGENNESGIRSRQVPVWRGLISIVLSVINSGPNNYYGIDRIPVCTGSGMYRLHYIFIMPRRSGILILKLLLLYLEAEHTTHSGCILQCNSFKLTIEYTF